MLRTPDTDAEDGGSGDASDLSVGVHTRISPAADALIKENARRDGVKPATWVRITIYEALGLLRRRGRK
jgi:hypothetical protein